MGLWTPFLAISLARDGADVVCGHLMMRSFSLNENFALLAVERVRVRDLEEGERVRGSANFVAAARTKMETL